MSPSSQKLRAQKGTHVSNRTGIHIWWGADLHTGQSQTSPSGFLGVMDLLPRVCNFPVWVLWWPLPVRPHHHSRVKLYSRWSWGEFCSNILFHPDRDILHQALTGHWALTNLQNRSALGPLPIYRILVASLCCQVSISLLLFFLSLSCPSGWLPSLAASLRWLRSASYGATRKTPFRTATNPLHWATWDFISPSSTAFIKAYSAYMYTSPNHEYEL